MFISEKNSRKVLKTLFIYVGITAFVALFGFVYELNSHNVYSFSMAFAWIYPLILGVGMYLLMYFMPTKYVPGQIIACTYGFGVAMITIRSIFIGVIDIYGTTNKNMVLIYTVLSWIFVTIGVGSFLFILIYGVIKKHQQSKTSASE